jgi:hypothetical protein
MITLELNEDEFELVIHALRRLELDESSEIVTQANNAQILANRLKYCELSPIVEALEEHEKIRLNDFFASLQRYPYMEEEE